MLKVVRLAGFESASYGSEVCYWFLFVIYLTA